MRTHTAFVYVCVQLLRTYIAYILRKLCIFRILIQHFVRVERLLRTYEAFCLRWAAFVYVYGFCARWADFDSLKLSMIQSWGFFDLLKVSMIRYWGFFDLLKVLMIQSWGFFGLLKLLMIQSWGFFDLLKDLMIRSWGFSVERSACYIWNVWSIRSSGFRRVIYLTICSLLTFRS